MNSSQRRAIETHRRRLGERGLARYEVRGLVRDKELVRALARRLAADDGAAAELRGEVARGVSEAPLNGATIWRFLRESPLVGVEIDLDREAGTGRDVLL